MMRRPCVWAVWVVCAAAGLLPGAVRASDAEVRAAIAAFVQAFNAGDAEALAAAWAETAVHIDVGTGERTEGRAAILADIAAAQQARPGLRLAGQVDEVRLVTADVAQARGWTSIGAADEEPSLSAFSAILVKSGERWVIDSIEEGPVPQPATAHDALRELEWLVGEWVDESESVRVETSFRWSPGGAYLIRSFSAQTADGAARQGTQLIGWDPRALQIRSWTFEQDGSFGDGTWSRNGESWLVKSSQTLADGRAASGTFVLTRESDDAITLRLIGHEIEGEPQPTNPAVRMVRAAAPAAPGGSGAAPPPRPAPPPAPRPAPPTVPAPRP